MSWLRCKHPHADEGVDTATTCRVSAELLSHQMLGFVSHPGKRKVGGLQSLSSRFAQEGTIACRVSAKQILQETHVRVFTCIVRLRQAMASGGDVRKKKNGRTCEGKLPQCCGKAVLPCGNVFQREIVHPHLERGSTLNHFQFCVACDPATLANVIPMVWAYG